MDRRRLLQLLGGSALSLPFAGLGATARKPALPLDPLAQAAHDFRQARRRNPVLAGFDDVTGDGTARVAASIRGRWPDSLQGALYRNGPGRWERGGQRYSHWFDGDGLVQHWLVRDGKVSHQSRFVRTDKWAAEERAGRFVRAAAGSTIPDHQPVTGPDDLNAANISVLALEGKLYALWEAGSAHEIDPETLATRGLTTWRDDLQAVPFSAHPLRDVDGTVWNFGLFGRRLLLWHLAADGRVLDFQMQELPRGGYVHSFAITAKRLVFVLAPLWMEEFRGSFFESLRWHGEQPSLAVVVDKSALAGSPRLVELPAGMAYHYADAWDRDDGGVSLRASWYADGGTASAPFAGYMRGDMRQASALQSRTVELILPARGDGRLRDLQIANTEFAIAREPAARSELLLLQGSPKAGHGLNDKLIRVNAEGTVVGRHRQAAGVAVEEHLWVRDSRGRVYALGTVFDWRRERTGLQLLDAEHLDDGPIAEAWLPRAMPLGFHGCWVGAAA